MLTKINEQKLQIEKKLQPYYDLIVSQENYTEITKTRAGIKKVILPEANKPQLAEIPKEVREQIEIVLVKHMKEVVDLVLLKDEKD
jgi:predicted ATP-dependent protease